VVATPIRIFLGDMPRLVRDLIEQAVAEAPDLSVVAVRADDVDLARAAEDAGAELVIVAMDDDELPPSAQAYLDRRARVAVIGVEVDDGSAVLYRLRPQRRPIGPVSPRELVDAIRAAAGGGA
jgi:AmiR/NasT family two-component response regulator